MTNLVSIVIPCFNQGHFLKEAVSSALQQDYPAKEVIVINDGSSDSTGDVAAAFGNAILYIEQPNRGLSAARNTGIRASKGEYICFLDSDDILTPGSVGLRALFLDKHPNTGLVCGDTLMFNETGTLGLVSERVGKVRHPTNFRWETVERCVIPSSCMCRSSCFDQAGVFDESLREGGEDWLMWVGISLHFDMTYLDTPCVLRRVHSANITRDNERLSRGNRQAYDIAVKMPHFMDYPAHYRSKLLYYRFAAAWNMEPKGVALRYFLRAFQTDPARIVFGLCVIFKGIRRKAKRALSGG